MDIRCLSMPANIPPQAKAAEQRYIQAKALPEKIKCLQEFISLIPEHKGNEKMRGYLRRRLAQLKDEQEELRKRKVGGGGGGFSIRKEGAAQIVILGMTGVGKSSLLMGLTNAKTEVGGHRFTTTEPVPGMMKYEDIQFQLLDTPAIYEGVGDGSWGPQLMSLVRNADGIIIVLEAPHAIEHYATIIGELSKAGITTDRRVRKIEIEKTTGGGIQIACTGRPSCRVEDIEKALKNNGVRNALVRIWGDITMEDVVESLEQTKLFKPSLVIINKTDLTPGAEAAFQRATGRHALGISLKDTRRLEGVGGELFRALGIIRVYTRVLGGDVAKKPIIVKEGAKVLDIAKIVHSQFYHNFKHARIFGKSVKFNGERVGAEHELVDRDVVEIRIK
jgi:small GTP-binding protein